MKICQTAKRFRTTGVAIAITTCLFAARAEDPHQAPAASKPSQNIEMSREMTLDECVSSPAQTLKIPTQDIKLMDPDSFVGTLNATWLLYDGGMRKGYRERSASRPGEYDGTDLEQQDQTQRYGNSLRALC